MTSVGPLQIVGDFADRDVALVEELLALDWPWHVLARLDSPQVRFTARDSQLGGVLRGNTAEIWGRFQPDHLVRSTRWAVHHEVGHLLDRATYSPSLTARRTHLRDELHVLMHPHDSHDHLTSDRPLPDGMHSWSSDGTDTRRDAPSEAFAEWFAWVTGSRQRTSLGHHSWAVTADEIEATFRRHVQEAAVPDQPAPFPDLEHADDELREAAAWASSNGLVTGTKDGRFDGHSAVSRSQLVRILYRLLRGDDD